MAEIKTQNTSGESGYFKGEVVSILYTNWRGETAVRRIVPSSQHEGLNALWLGETEWHPSAQWLLSARDVEKDAHRVFALSGIKAWGQEAVDAALAAPAAKGGTTWRPMSTAPKDGKTQIVAKHKPNEHTPDGWIATITIDPDDGEYRRGGLDTIKHYNGDALMHGFHGVWTGWLYPHEVASPPPPAGAAGGSSGDLGALSAGATPGPWYVEREPTDGSYGSGEDGGEGYDAFAIRTEAEKHYGSPGTLFESHNSTVGCVETESNEDDFSAWDAVAKANAEFVVAIVNAYRSGRLIEASAPTPDLGAQGEPKHPINTATEWLRAMRENVERERVQCEPKSDRAKMLGGVIDMLDTAFFYRPPGPPEQGKPFAWSHEVFDGQEWTLMFNAHQCPWPTEGRRNINALYNYPVGLPSEAEPAAWVYHQQYEDGSWAFVASRAKPEPNERHYDVRPLYDRPSHTIARPDDRSFCECRIGQCRFLTERCREVEA